MTVSLLLGVHAHQPVGNFPAVIDEAHERCYGPFLRLLHGYPDFRFAVHFSGWLLDYLEARFPDDLALLAEMAGRGQVELFGSGDCEPVLAAIPHADRVAQLDTLSDKLAARYGGRPRGAWLTERVWDSSVVPALLAAGIRYVAVDDYHFFCTGKTAADLDGHFSTEEGGDRIDLFPISEQLRYRLPFSPARDAVAYLEGLADAGHHAAVYFDDIEKFGIWPETYDWVYTRRWLADFVEGVLASPKIRTATYADFHARTPTRGVVYLPTTSYIEMNEWTLPMPAAADYAELVQQEKDAGRFERHRPFLRGGIWRNFLTRYGEANWMHKRMLGLSRRLAVAESQLANSPPAGLRAALHRAQANDAYWHGLFGGIYLPHLRRAVWKNLIELEAGLDRLAPGPATSCGDVDLDGHDEILLRSAGHRAWVRLDGLGAVHEWSSERLGHNFGDTLRRYAEHYHAKAGAAEPPGPADPGDGIASAHDIVRSKHPIAAEDLVADRLPRALFVDSLARAGLVPVPMDNYALPDGATPAPPAVELEAAADGSHVAKRIAVAPDRLMVRWRFRGLAGWRFATQLNLAMPSCDGYAGRYVLADGRIPCGFGQPLDLPDTTALTLDDGELGGGVALAASSPVAITARPLQTVSQSEAGFEKIMQAAELTLAAAIPDDDWTLEIDLSLVVAPQPE